MTKRISSGKPQNGSVGYGMPPKEHQFKPGKSGNKNGRPKKSHSVADGILAQYTESSALRINGKTVKMPHVAAVLLNLRVAALRGDVRAATAYLKFAQTLGLFDFLDRLLKATTASRLIVEYVEGPSPPKPVVRT